MRKEELFKTMIEAVEKYTPLIELKVSNEERSQIIKNNDEQARIFMDACKEMDILCDEYSCRGIKIKMNNNNLTAEEAVSRFIEKNTKFENSELGRLSKKYNCYKVLKHYAEYTEDSKLEVTVLEKENKLVLHYFNTELEAPGVTVIDTNTGERIGKYNAKRHSQEYNEYNELLQEFKNTANKGEGNMRQQELIKMMIGAVEKYKVAIEPKNKKGRKEYLGIVRSNSEQTGIFMYACKELNIPCTKSSCQIVNFDKISKSLTAEEAVNRFLEKANMNNKEEQPVMEKENKEEVIVNDNKREENIMKTTAGNSKEEKIMTENKKEERFIGIGNVMDALEKQIGIGAEFDFENTNNNKEETIMKSQEEQRKEEKVMSENKKEEAVNSQEQNKEVVTEKTKETKNKEKKNKKMGKKDYTLSGKVTAGTWEEFVKEMKKLGIKTGHKSYDALVEEFNALNDTKYKQLTIFNTTSSPFAVEEIVAEEMPLTENEIAVELLKFVPLIKEKLEIDNLKGYEANVALKGFTEKLFESFIKQLESAKENKVKTSKITHKETITETSKEEKVTPKETSAKEENQIPEKPAKEVIAKVVTNICDASFVATKGCCKDLRIVAFKKLFGIIKDAYSTDGKNVERSIIDKCINKCIGLGYLEARVFKEEGYKESVTIYLVTDKAFEQKKGKSNINNNANKKDTEQKTETKDNGNVNNDIQINQETNNGTEDRLSAYLNYITSSGDRKIKATTTEKDGVKVTTDNSLVKKDNAITFYNVTINKKYGALTLFNDKDTVIVAWKAYNAKEQYVRMSKEDANLFYKHMLANKVTGNIIRYNGDKVMNLYNEYKKAKTTKNNEVVA